MVPSPSLPLALRWLLTERGVSEQELAVLAGVSPGAVIAFLGKPHAATLTWLNLLAALGCQIAVKAPQRSLHIALPRIAIRRRERERAQWEARRLTAFRTQVQRQRPDLPPAEAHRIAVGYVAASASRLADDLAAAGARLQAARVEAAVAGPRAALAAIAAAAQVNAEDLALLAGISLSAVQTALDASEEGRLATPHRLFSALAVRLVVHPAGGGAVAIDLAGPGAWRPEAPRAGRCGLSHDEILALARSGEPLAGIARTAGVSRQRVHAIVRG